MAHRRLTIIDLATGDQPMTDSAGDWITYNGEIYNYLELRAEIGEHEFRTTSDTEVVLLAYRKWGPACVERLRGMFSFAIWDEQESRLFCARDRFGVKPFVFTVVDGVFYMASEAKALLPFLPAIETDQEALQDYLTFQFCLDGKTLFKGVTELLPAHTLTIQGGALNTRRYWEVAFEPDHDHTEEWFTKRLRDTVAESTRLHLRADVPVGAYLSGGLDSSIIAAVASGEEGSGFMAFTGRFDDPAGYDESPYARLAAKAGNFELVETAISAADFEGSISDVIYHLDYPVAGPGSFPQYMVSAAARRHRKVVLGGQGGDEIFGGYARYLLAYFEQCIKAAIEGTMHDGNFVVTYESIIPQLGTLREYKPLMQEFWRDGLFGDLDERYFRLVDRAPELRHAIDWHGLGANAYSPFETFRSIFRADNVRKESYFDLMTHFDSKTLLPALLHVEDRVSMAHGLESRVPFVDTNVVELARDSSSRREVSAGPPEARAEAGVRRCRAGRDPASPGQDGLPGAAGRVDERRAPRLRERRPHRGSGRSSVPPGRSRPERWRSGRRESSVAMCGRSSRSSCGSVSSTTGSPRGPRCSSTARRPRRR